MVLKATPARWWDTHKEDLTWDAMQPAMIHRFAIRIRNSTTIVAHDKTLHIAQELREEEA